MRYGIIFFLASILCLGLQAQDELPDELRLLRSFEIETNYVTASAETVISRDGQTGASFLQGRGNFSILFWDTSEGETFLEIEGEGIPEDIAISDDGEKFALIVGREILVYELVELVELAETSEDELVSEAVFQSASPVRLMSRAEDELLSSVHFSPNALFILATTTRNNLLIWNTRQGEAEANVPIVAVTDILEPGLTVVENSPVYFGADGLYFIVNTNRLRREASHFLARLNGDFTIELLSPELPPANLRYLQISEDTEWLLAFNMLENSFVIQNSLTGEARAILGADIQDPPDFLTIETGIMREDASVLLISSEGNLRLFDIATGQELARSPTEGGSFMKLHFISPTLIALSYQDRVQIYEWIANE
jgi:hypothetical protein